MSKFAAGLHWCCRCSRCGNIFSLSRILVKLGLSKGHVGQAHYTSVILNNLILWPTAAWYTLRTGKIPDLLTITVFLLAGVFATGLGRIFTFTTLNKMSVRVNTIHFHLTALCNNDSNNLHGEKPTLNTLVGTIIVIVGLSLVSRLSEYTKRFSVFVGLLASFFYGIGEVLRKYGTTITPNPPVGAAIGSLEALTFLPFYKANTISSFTVNKLFFMSGISTSLALLLVFVSYSLIPLVMAVPLINTAPLFTICLSLLIARRFENFSVKVIAGGLTVMVGILFIVS